MKKVTIILLSLLLVLTVGQAAFAKNYLGLSLGYDGSRGSHKYVYEVDDYDVSNLTQNAFKASLFLNTYLTSRFSLAAGITIKTGTEIVENYGYYDDEKHPYDYRENKNTDLDFYLFGRYDIFKWDKANVGAQLGLMNTAKIVSENSRAVKASTLSKKSTNYYVENISLLALGIYGDFYVTPKLNLYTDIKFPIGFWGNTVYDNVSFFKGFLYDVILGATYEIYPNIGLGIETSISNVNYYGINVALNKQYGLDDNEERSYFNFSIGAKVGYRF